MTAHHYEIKACGNRIYWRMDGKDHRVGGPAAVFESGGRYWGWKGCVYSETDFKKQGYGEKSHSRTT